MPVTIKNNSASGLRKSILAVGTLPLTKPSIVTLFTNLPDSEKHVSGPDQGLFTAEVQARSEEKTQGTRWDSPYIVHHPEDDSEIETSASVLLQFLKLHGLRLFGEVFCFVFFKEVSKM